MLVRKIIWQADHKRERVLAACSARAVLFTPSRKKGRREDRAPAGTHKTPVLNRLHTQFTGETQGSQDQAFPARWFDGLCRALPGAEFLLASLTPTKCTAARRLTR